MRLEDAIPAIVRMTLEYNADLLPPLSPAAKSDIGERIKKRYENLKVIPFRNAESAWIARESIREARGR